MHTNTKQDLDVVILVDATKLEGVRLDEILLREVLGVALCIVNPDNDLVDLNTRKAKHRGTNTKAGRYGGAVGDDV